ncbi:hypothetical protein X975_08961, partial [Stegodyphus mimosarum]
MLRIQPCQQPVLSFSGIISVSSACIYRSSTIIPSSSFSLLEFQASPTSSSATEGLLRLATF